MAILTSRIQASGVTLDDLIHIVITSDQSQNPAGSSYKATIGQVFDSLSSYTFTNLNVSGNTILNGLSANTLNVNGVQITGDTFSTGGTFDNTTSYINVTKNDGTSYIIDMGGSSGLPETDGRTIEINTTNNTIQLMDIVQPPLSGGPRTFVGDIVISGGSLNVLGDITGNTISATTYLGLPGDIYITGGTFDKNTETLTLDSSSGSPITITGFTDIYVTGFTYDDANTITLSQSNGQSSGVTLNTFTGLTINGGLSATSISADTYYNLPSYTEVTYSELTSLIGSSGLTEGSYYLITDFQTIYDQPDYYANSECYRVYCNASPRTPITKTGLTEPILVLSTSNSTISLDAYQPKYPKDTIKYDWSWSQTEYNNLPTKGRINERIDEYGNRTDYDHRNVIFKRYKTYNLNTKLSGTIKSYNSSTGVLIGENTQFTGLTPGQIIFIQGYPYFGVKISSITNNTSLVTQLDLTLTGFSFTNKTYNYFSTSSSGKFLNFKEFYIGQHDDGDFTEVPTFTMDGSSYNNYIGDFYNSFGKYLEVPSGDDFEYNNYFVLSNNVIGSYNHSNFFGQNSINNSFRDGGCYENICQSFCYNNTILSYYFVRNTIDNFFRYNISGSDDMHENKILANFAKNLIKSSFFQNEIGLLFGINLISSSFSANKIRNYFVGNEMYGYTSLNDIGVYFTNNIINGNCQRNRIKGLFSYNKINNEFNQNIVNTTYFQYNTGNTINDNIFYGESFDSNTLTSDFRKNTLKTSVTSTNFTSATHVYGNYNCEIFSNSSGNSRLSYYDSSDILTITGVTS
jgi:hypothetical protein